MSRPDRNQLASDTTLRMLAIADVHGEVAVYQWLKGLAAEHRVDAVVLAGDLLTGGWEDEQSEQSRTILIPLLRTFPAPVCYVMGNDDHIDLGCEEERIKPLHGRRVDLGAYALVGYCYSPPFMGGCHEKPEQDIAADLAQIESLLDRNTVLVTHAPCRGRVDRIYSGSHVGSLALADLLWRAPFLCHIHGHIHHSFGREGNHFNVAAGGRRRAMLIDLPSLSHRPIEVW